MAKRKILLVCLDGATWNVMEPLMRQNQLPNFSRLVEKGSYGIIFSEDAFSPPSWTSIATGKTKDRHSIYHFRDFKKRTARYIWEILSDYGKRVVVANWLMFFPERVNGAISKRINGAIWYQPFYVRREFYYPHKIQDEIRRVLSLPALPHFEFVEGYKFFNAFDIKVIKIASYLIKKYPPAFVAIGFSGLNPFQHRYWSAYEHQYFDISAEEVLEKRDLIPQYYKKVDTFLGFFIKNNYTIIFVSDHGFCRSDNRSGPRIARYYHLNSDIQHINFLANQLLYRMGFLEFIPKLEDGGQIDFLRSKAYFYNDSAKGIYGIRINRMHVPTDELLIAKRRICLLLQDIVFQTGERVFFDVRENSADNSLLDILFRLNPIFARDNLIFFDNPEKPHSLILPYVKGAKGKKIRRIIYKKQTLPLGDLINYSRDGVHEHEGVIILYGPNIRKNNRINVVHLYDVAPTVLYLMGVPVAKDLNGRIIRRAIEPDFLSRHPIRFTDTYEKQTKFMVVSQLEKDDLLRERLRSLGYVQ